MCVDSLIMAETDMIGWLVYSANVIVILQIY